MTRKPKPKVDPWLRVRVPDKLFPLPREGFLVCVGVGFAPWRRCHWQAVIWFDGERAAQNRAAILDPWDGRAVVDLSAPRLQLISEDTGALKQCIEIEDKLLK